MAVHELPGCVESERPQKSVPRELTLAERSQYVCCYFGSKHSCVLTYRRLGNFIIVGHWHTSSLASCYFWANISPQHFCTPWKLVQRQTDSASVLLLYFHLPDPWQLHFSKSGGKLYFFNQQTGQSSFECPTTSVASFL